MALRIAMRGASGLPVAYHRISELSIETNVRVGVMVRSYLDGSERQRELSGETTYHEDCYYSTEGMDDTAPLTVEEAYAWLKTERPEFADAEDC